METRVSLRYFVSYCSYNNGNNAVRRFDVLPDFPFTASETRRGY